MPRSATLGFPPNNGWNDPRRQLLAMAAAAELLALTSSSPAVIVTTGLLAWVIRLVLDTGA